MDTANSGLNPFFSSPHSHFQGMETMKSSLLISALITLALSIFCFLLGGAGVAGAVTGGGQVNGAVEGVFFIAKALLALSLILGALWLIKSPSRH